MMRELTIKEYAARERVTDRTVRNWIAKGAVVVRRTPGGQVRISESVAVFSMKNAEERGKPAE